MVARERRRLVRTLALGATALALAAALAALTLGALAADGGAWITHPATPVVAWGAAALLGGLALSLARRRLRRASVAAVARAIEGERGLRAGALRAAAESAAAGALGARASALMAERIASVGGALAPGARAAVRRRAAWEGLALAAALLFVAVTARRAPDGWRAVLHPRRVLDGTLLPPLAIRGAPSSVLRGDSVRITIDAPGRKTVAVRSRATGAAWAQQMVRVQDGAAATVLGPLDADLTLVASDGRAVSDTVTVRVRDRAFVGDVAIQAVYPRYLGRPPEPLAAGEPLRVPQGTVLRLEARASADLAAIGVVRDGASDTLRLATSAHRGRGALDVGTGGVWHWFARSAGGPIADVPAALEIQVIPDLAPRAEILAPAADTVVADGATVTMRVAASDDHGIATASLRGWREHGGRASPATEQLLAHPGAAAWAAEVPVDLAARGLEPGDALHLVLSVMDDSPWHQTGESRALVIRVPTLEETRALARSLGDSAAARTAAAASAERDLAQRTREAARSRTDRTGETATERTMRYETAQQAATLAQAQQQLAARVRDAQRDAAALERALKAAGALDTALARQLQDAQRLLRDALTPEMAKQLAAVMSAGKQLSADEMRRALEQLAAQQDKLRAELERTAAMLQRAALEGAMQTLRDDARDLAARSRAVADSLAAPDSAARRSAAQVSERSQALAAQIAALGERLAREHADAAARAMPPAGEHAQRAAQAMQRASAAPSSEAPAEGRTGASEMTQAAQQLAAAREEQVREWKQDLTAELDRASAEAMELAKAEDALADRAAAGSDSALRGDQSAVQQGTDRLAARLQRAAGQSAHVSPQSQRALAEARARVAEATREVAEGPRASREASPELAAASQALATAAAQMMRDRARAAGAQSASGFAELMQRMAELAKQQGGLNAQASGLLPAPGMTPGAAAAEQARALARQQRALARALEEAGQGDARSAQMAREMRDIAADLERNRIDPALLERQQRLFHRLMDAGLAMEKEEREDTGKRESRSAAEGPASAPANGPLSGRAANRYGVPDWNDLRGLSAEERAVIVDYFNRLNGATPP